MSPFSKPRKWSKKIMHIFITCMETEESKKYFSGSHACCKEKNLDSWWGSFHGPFWASAAPLLPKVSKRGKSLPPVFLWWWASQMPFCLGGGIFFWAYASPTNTRRQVKLEARESRLQGSRKWLNCRRVLVQKHINMEEWVAKYEHFFAAPRLGDLREEILNQLRLSPFQPTKQKRERSRITERRRTTKLCVDVFELCPAF